MSARTAAFLAALLAAVPASAYQQTRSSSGAGLHWTSSSVSWVLNTSRAASSPTCQASGSADPAGDAARAAFSTWANATHPGDAAPCTRLALPFAGTSTSIAIASGTSSEHLVVFREGWCSANPTAVADACYAAGTCGDKYNCFDDQGGLGRNVLALTTVMYLPSSGAIGDADMEVVDWDGLNSSGSLSSQPDGWYWTCFVPANSDRPCTTYGQAGCYYMDLQNTITHEAGHFIGLAHPCEMDSTAASAEGVPLCSSNPAAFSPTTMYPSASIGETSKRTLSADDVNGVCAIYSLSGGGGSSSHSGGCGSGGATPVGLMALALALAVLLPRRRRARR